jgi:hypothetical protein
VADPRRYALPPHGFRVVSDNEPEQNSTNLSDLHAGFQLSKEGDTIALFAPDGTRVDSVAFGAQAEDVSQGCYPDGQAAIAFLTWPTPGAPNATPYSTPSAGLQLDPQAVQVVGDQLVLGWVATTGHVYQVQYTDNLTLPVWLPLGSDLTATAPVLSVRTLVSAQPQRFFRVAEINAGTAP